MDVLTLVLLGLVGVTVVVVILVRRASRHSSLRPATTGIASARSTSRAPAFVLYGVATVGVVAGIVLGNLPGPGNDLFACPSVFQWNGFSSDEQLLMNTFTGGGCAGHVRAMTVAMVIAFVVAAIAGIIAVVVTIGRASSRRSGAPAVASASPPAWHPIPGQPGTLRWWDGTAWTDHIHDQNAPGS